MAGKSRTVGKPDGPPKPAKPNPLPLTMEQQQQSNWCWIAVAVSVKRFYDPAFARSQCEIANAALSQSGCCTDGASAACNRSNAIDNAFREVAIDSRAKPDADARTRDYVTAEIDANRPVVCYISWNGGGGHFCCIAGYDAANVIIRDPLWGASTMPLEQFRDAYLGVGKWTYTYFVPRS